MSSPAPSQVETGAGPRHADGDAALICLVRGLTCALPLSAVVETMRPQPVEPLASAPALVLGVAIVRGEPVPVVDVGALLGSALPRRPSRFITLSIEGRTVALSVEGVVGVRNLPVAALGELPPLLRDASADVIASVGRLDSALLVVLRAARILPEAVWSALARARGPT